jgi:hypothetical protein
VSTRMQRCALVCPYSDQEKAKFDLTDARWLQVTLDGSFHVEIGQAFSSYVEPPTNDSDPHVCATASCACLTSSIKCLNMYVCACAHRFPSSKPPLLVTLPRR